MRDGGVSRCAYWRRNEDLTKTKKNVTCASCVLLIEYDEDHEMEVKVGRRVNKKQIDWPAVFGAIAQECHKRKENAGYGGEWGDHGASELEKEVKFFKMGMKGEMPEEWKPYTTSLDPEYAEYQRLKRKFGGRQ